jgi:Rrf2 family nitric oxide-sensitive transcriptional repressor
MLSQTVEYAMRAMGHLAALGGEAATSGAIAEATGVPRGYLSKIMRDLVCAELVQSFRGRHGGFILSRDAASISVLDIVNAVDPIRRTTARPGTPFCGMHKCLEEAVTQMEETFRHETLAGLIAPGPITPGHNTPGRGGDRPGTDQEHTESRHRRHAS